MSLINHCSGMYNCIKKNKVTVFKVALLAICFLLLYYDVFVKMVYDWIHLPDFSHGFFIPLISLYFIWDQRERLKLLPVESGNLGLAIIILGLLLFMLGKLASESFTLRFSFIVVLAGVTLFFLGKRYFKVLFFPIIFLVLMIPIPSIIMTNITFPMQLFASNIAEKSLQFMNIPVLREGNIIILADTTLEVAEACSGIRSLISLLALSIVFAYIANKSLFKRVILIFSCIPVAILVNAFRVSATGILANYYGITVAEGFFHDFSGYLLFLVAFFILLILNFFLTKIWSVKNIR